MAEGYNESRETANGDGIGGWGPTNQTRPRMGTDSGEGDWDNGAIGGVRKSEFGVRGAKGEGRGRSAEMRSNNHELHGLRESEFRRQR